MFNTNGLSSLEVLESRKKYGNNSFTRKKQKSFIRCFIETLGDPIIKILLIALAIKTLFLFRNFDWFETIGIVIAILLASFISTISEYGSEQAFNRLQEDSQKILCKVIRNGNLVEIKIDEIVVGDVVKLETGDMVPADGFIIEGELSVDESSINGETKEAYKEKVKDKITDNNRIYRGSVVYSKMALMRVEKIGSNTFYGKIASELQEESPISPLKIRLTKLAKIISVIGYIGAFLVSFGYLFDQIVVENGFVLTKIMDTITNFPLMFSHILYALTLAVTIIVVAVPEGLPMMITLVLSSNMKRMLKNNVLVRKLVGIETAGNLNILFTDKTGTLTKGKFEVMGLISGNLKKYNNELEFSSYEKFKKMVELSLILNNDSNISKDSKIVGGNLTDRVLLTFVHSNCNNIKVINKEPFSSSLKYSKCIIMDKRKIMLIKGAPEIILDKCINYLDESGEKKIIEKDRINQKIKELTVNGYRIIALAFNDQVDYENINKLTFLGLILIKDDVREEAIEGVKLVNNAGIQTIMITGDNKETACAIGKEVGIINSSDDIVLTSKELNKLSDKDIFKILPKLKIVARSLPQDKSRLVKIALDNDLVVGMTGDGVNDAPALKKASVGFSMGSGTEVAKEASDIVILDDNFLSIAKAILFGRTIFKSIRKFIIFQLTINMCAILLSLICPFIGIDTPVTVIQMLWINMIMDTLAGLAFSYEAPLLSYMKERPKKNSESIINRYMVTEILSSGIYSSFLCLFFLKSDFIKNLFRIDSVNKYLMTAFFALFIFMSIFNLFNARTTRINLLNNILKNKIFIFIVCLIVLVQLIIIYFGGDMFRSYGLTWKELFLVFILSFSVIPFDIIRKIIYQKKYNETYI